MVDRAMKLTRVVVLPFAIVGVGCVFILFFWFDYCMGVIDA